MNQDASPPAPHRGGSVPQFGIYFYPWYCAKRWQETPRLLTPALHGEYDSSDPEVARWQAEKIVRCGFDYVIFELVPVADWGFTSNARAINGLIPLLHAMGVRWSFLMDAFVSADRAGALTEMSALVEYIERQGWTDGLIYGPAGKPLLFCFFPIPAVALNLTRQTPQYELRYPAYFPHWGDPNVDLHRYHMTPWRECCELARNESATLFDALAPHGYVSFFETTAQKNNFAGFASAIPAFDDRHQQRDPKQVPALPVIDAQGGATIRREIISAAATKAEHVIVYGWNEYFENAVLEPTRDQSALLTDSCRDAMAELRAFSAS